MEAEGRTQPVEPVKEEAQSVEPVAKAESGAQPIDPVVKAEGQPVLEAIDRIASTFGYANFGQFRQSLNQAAAMLKNLGELTAILVSLTDEEINTLANGLNSEGRDYVIRMMADLEGYLPFLKRGIANDLEKKLPSKTGRDKSFEDRKSMRIAITKILDRIAKGESEPRAKRAVALDLDISQPTLNQVWNNRATLMAEESASELMNRLLSLLSTCSISPPPPSLSGGEVSSPAGDDKGS